MSLRSNLRGFVEAFLRRRTTSSRRPRHGGDALARTARDTLGKRVLSVDRSRTYGQIEDGADRYDRSFDE